MSEEFIGVGRAVPFTTWWARRLMSFWGRCVLIEYSGESVPLIPGESVPVIPGEYGTTDSGAKCTTIFMPDLMLELKKLFPNSFFSMTRLSTQFGGHFRPIDP